MSRDAPTSTAKVYVDDLSRAKNLLEHDNVVDLQILLGISASPKNFNMFLKDTLFGNEWTPLHFAVRCESVSAARFLINKGANANARDARGRTPLHVAVEFNNQYATERPMLTLLTNHCNVNAQDIEGATPLHYAVKRIDEVSIKHLLAIKSIEPNVRDKNLGLPLHYAIMRYKPSVLRMILDDIWERDWNLFWSHRDLFSTDQSTPLHFAASEGRADAVLDLLSHNISKVLHINQKNEKNETAVMKAVINGHFEVCKIFIDRGALVSLRATNKDGDTLMDIAAKKGYADIFKLLYTHEYSDTVAKDALNVSDRQICQTRSGLEHACRAGHLEVVRWIVDNCWIEARKEKKNFLSVAIEAGQKLVVKYLIRDSFLWYQALDNYFLTEENVRDSPMQQLVRTMPDVAMMVLDKCAQTDHSANASHGVCDDPHANCKNCIWNKKHRPK